VGRCSGHALCFWAQLVGLCQTGPIEVSCLLLHLEGTWAIGHRLVDTATTYRRSSPEISGSKVCPRREETATRRRSVVHRVAPGVSLIAARSCAST